MVAEVIIGIPLFFICMWISRILFSILLIKLLGKVVGEMKDNAMNSLNDLKGGNGDNGSQNEGSTSGRGNQEDNSEN